MRLEERSQFVEKLLDISINSQVRRVHVALQIAVGAVVVAVVDEINNHVTTTQLALHVTARRPWARTYEVAFLRREVEVLLRRCHQSCLVGRGRYGGQSVDDLSGHVWQMGEYVCRNRAIDNLAIN